MNRKERDKKANYLSFWVQSNLDLFHVSQHDVFVLNYRETEKSGPVF